MYTDSLTLARARREFFAHTGYSEREYSSWLAKVKIGPLPFYFYNFKARRRAVPMHDVHHILTGYDTSIVGEAQISAWELGSGYRARDFTFVMVLMGATSGLLIHREKTIAAFLRGLKSRNFYGQTVNQKMLMKTLGQLRKELGL